MFAPANTAHFTLAIPHLDHDFKVLAFEGTEAISQPYSFELDLVSERPDLDIEKLLHQPAFLSYAGPDQGVHGLIHSVAQGDWDQNIQRDQHIRVGNERHDPIEANSYTELLAEEHHTAHTAHADRKTEIKADDHLTVANNQHVKIGTGHFIETGNEIHYYAGTNLVIDAGMELTANAGGSFLKIDPSGVSLVGPQVRMNSGGSAGIGTGAKPLLPGEVMPADAATPGALLEQRLQAPKNICVECWLKALHENQPMLTGE